MRNIPLKSLAFLFISSIFLYSCGKSGTYPTIPQITFKSINPQEVHKGTLPDNGVIQITMGFRSAGNMTQDSLYVEQSNNPGYNPYPMPASTPDEKNLEGNIVFNLFKTYIFVTQNPLGDTVHFNIFVRDPSGKNSDTIQTSQIVIFNN